MSWRDDCDGMDTLLRESMPRARKEQTCCEHDLPKIAVGQEYLYVAATWKRSEGGIYFKGYKLCLRCRSDWETVLNVFNKNDKYYDNCIVYGRLKEAIQEALEYGFIYEDHPLVKKWYPEIYWDFLKKEGMVEEETAWKHIEDDNIRKGLQPALF